MHGSWFSVWKRKDERKNTCDTVMREFEVTAEVERTWLVLFVDQWRNSDVTLPASGAERVQQMKYVGRTSDDAVGRRHAPTFAHSSVLGVTDHDHLVLVLTTKSRHLALTVRLHSVCGSNIHLSLFRIKCSSDRARKDRKRIRTAKKERQNHGRPNR